KQIADQEVLYDKMSVQLVELDKHVRDLKNTVLERDFKIFELKECVRNKDLEIEKYLKRLNDCENKLYKMGQTNQTVHMIMPSKDKMYNGRKGIGFENPSYFCKAKDLRPTLYDERVINLGYTLMFLTHSDEALEIEKFKKAIENKIKFAYDYGNMNASYVNLDTLSSVGRPKPSGVMWIRKGSSNTVKADLSSVNHSNLKKNVKRYSRKNLMACNNSDTRSAFDCNNARNALCNARMNASVDVNDLFVFDNVSIRKSHVSKMSFRKKPSASLNVPSRISWTVHFGNNDFAVIAGYGNVVIGSMMIKKVYYVEGLGHNLFSVGQFCDKGLEVTFRKSTCFVRTKDGVDLLTGDRSLNLYTIALNKVTSNSSACLLAKASSSQSWLWHQRPLHLNFATINNLVENNLVQGLPNMKFKKDHLCFACEQGKIHWKHHKSKSAFASNKPLYLLHMDLCGSMRIESINEKRYVLVVVDDYLRYMETSKKDLEDLFQNFYDEFDSSKIMNSSTTNVETSNNEGEVFHEVSESFQEESSLSSLNDDVQQSPKEVILPQINTQSISNNMIPKVDEASTSHDVFNEHLEDAYFDASTSFNDPSNVHTFYQPYPHEEKWTKDHPLYKIIGDPKSSVRTRGQLLNSSLFSCLLSSIEPANVAEALRDADWVSAM
nr:integrase, catalytic region, zinc finger, CCHC-type, peptidase aspartic, catalytic [Tanacetum cinerariifolium]